MGQPPEFHLCGTRQRPRLHQNALSFVLGEVCFPFEAWIFYDIPDCDVKPSGQQGQTDWYTVSSCMHVWVYEYVWVCLLLYRLQSNTHKACCHPSLSEHMHDLQPTPWVKGLRKSSCLKGLTQFDQDPGLNLVEPPLLILKAIPMFFRSRQHIQSFL